MTTPIVAAHIYLWDNPPGDYPQSGGSWDYIPDDWKKFRFDACDVLIVTPFVVKLPNYEFGLGTRNSGQSSVTKRFEWVIANARAQRPSIRIIASQWYNADADGYDYDVLKSDDSIAKYTDSVAALLRAYQNKTLTSDSGQSVSGRIDGYDVDFEGTTLRPCLAAVCSQLRSKFDAISRSPPFYISVTPAWLDHLNDARLGTSLDHVYMQNYSGGDRTTPGNYLNTVPGLKPGQLIYGITSEEPWRCTASASLDTAFSAYSAGVNGASFGGMWAWRLNSDNRIYENMLQVTIYNKVHNTQLPHTPKLDMVKNGWPTGGRKTSSAQNTPGGTPPWDTFSWQE